MRSITAVQDLAAFRRFLSLLATRHGQVLNRLDLAAPLGMSVPGISRGLDILEATGQILIVPPWFENLGKRLIEAKTTRTPTPDMAMSMRRLAQAFANHSGARRGVEMLLVYRSPRQPVGSRALAPGVQALPWQQLVA